MTEDSFDKYNPQELQQKYEEWCELHRKQLEAQQQFCALKPCKTS